MTRTALFIATLVIAFTFTSIPATLMPNMDVAIAQQSATITNNPVLAQDTPKEVVKVATTGATPDPFKPLARNWEYVDFQIEKIYLCIMKKMNTPVIDVKKYGGKQVAIVKGKIVAADTTTEKVLKSVRLKLPSATWRDILLVTVPEGITVAYCV